MEFGEEKNTEDSERTKNMEFEEPTQTIDTSSRGSLSKRRGRCRRRLRPQFVSQSSAAGGAEDVDDTTVPHCSLQAQETQAEQCQSSPLPSCLSAKPAPALTHL